MKIKFVYDLREVAPLILMIPALVGVFAGLKWYLITITDLITRLPW